MLRRYLALIVLASAFVSSAEAQGLLDRLKREAAEELEERLRSARDRDEEPEAPAPPPAPSAPPAVSPAVGRAAVERGAPAPAASANALGAEAQRLANECATAAAAQSNPDSEAAGIARNCSTACTSIGGGLAQLTDDASRNGMMDLCRGAHANVFGLAPPASVVAARENRGARTLGPPPSDAADDNSVIHAERFYRYYRSRGPAWCSDAASFDLVYVQGAMLGTDTQGGVVSDAALKMLEIKKAGCPAATRFRVNVIPNHRDAAVERQFTYRHQFDTFTGNGTTFTGNDRLVADPPLPPVERSSSVAQFRGYNLAGLLGNIHELKPGMVGRNDFRTSTLFTMYVNLFAERCASALPPDKVTFVHRERQLIHTQYGFLQTTRYYQDVITGTTDMRPEFLATYAAAFNYTGQRLVAEFMNNMYDGSDDAIGKTIGGLGEFQAAAEPDLQRLLAEQGCASAFTRQFERNLEKAVADAPPAELNELALVNNLPVYRASQDFSPPIPKLAEPAGGYGVYVDKERNGKTLRQVIASRLIGSLSWARFTPSDQQPIVDADITAIWKEGGAMLECTYESGVERYWLNERVPAADPARLRSRHATHPLLAVGEPRDRCPPLATR